MINGKRNFVKEKRIKFEVLGGGLSFLAFLSCFTVGFSNWVHINIKDDNSKLNVDIGKFINLSEYLNAPSVNYFEVCPTGLVVDETITYTGTITINTKILLKDGLLNNYDSTLTSLGFKFLITNNGTYNYFVSNFMGGTNSPEVQYSFYLDNNTPFYNLTTSTISGNSIISELIFNDPLLQTYENINLNVIYSFDFSSYKDNFKADIYDHLGENPLSFMMNLEVK